jgi:hypothetical protein
MVMSPGNRPFGETVIRRSLLSSGSVYDSREASSRIRVTVATRDWPNCAKSPPNGPVAALSQSFNPLPQARP